MFKVIGTYTYLRELQKLPKRDYNSAEKIPKKLAENPFVGKQLSYHFLREKKIGGRRIYYLVYEDLELVLLVAISDKRNQQATIDHIRENLKEFRQVAEDVSTQVS